MLTLIATPIGNLKDITIRSLENLEQADLIVCEDTRRTSILLNQYRIKKPMIALNDFNETKMIDKVIEQLRLGANIALVSDAGTPLISDPGYKLVRECLKLDIPVDSLPGPSSVITALTLSGLPPDKFMFLGFLPDKPSNRKKIYQNVKDFNKVSSLTYILFLSPYKLAATLNEFLEEFGDIEITLAQELTKIHQAVTTKTLSNWIKKFEKTNPQGEWVMLFNY
jgi:16S rRNA (cytidine1402-2'-O)-methyltransferase